MYSIWQLLFIFNVIQCSPDNFIIYGDVGRRHIYTLNLTDEKHERLIIEGHVFPSGVDYDPVTARVYWAEGGLDNITGKSWLGFAPLLITPLESAKIINLGDAGEAYDIAVDYVSGAVYYTDSWDKMIGVLDKELTYIHTLYRSELVGPKSLTLDPIAGYIYFTEYTNRRPNYEHGRIIKGRMDGQAIQVLISTNVLAPTGIVLDRPANRIYWCDFGYYNVQSATTTGSDRRALLQDVNNPFISVALDESFLYFSSLRYSSLRRSLKHQPSQIENFGPIARIEEDVARVNIFGLKLYKSSLQINDGNNCSVNNGGCSHICAPTTHRNKKCLCPDNFYQESETNCKKVPLSKYLLFADKSRRTIYQMDLEVDGYVRTPMIGHGTPVSIDVDYSTGLYYWTDPYRHWIARADLHHSFAEVFYQNQNVEPDGIVLDASRQLLYIADVRGRQILQLSISKINSEITTLFTNSGKTLKALALDNIHEFVYWTVVAPYPMIERGSIKGGGITTVIDTDIQQPTDIVLDTQGKYIYWCDGMQGRIERVSVKDYTDRTVIFHRASLRVATLTLDTDYIYFAADGEPTMYRVSKSGGQEQMFGKNHFSQISDVIFVDASNISVGSEYPTGCSRDILLPCTTDMTSVINTTPNKTSPPSNGLTLPITAGIIVGGVVLVVLILVIGITLCKKIGSLNRKRK